MESNKKKVLVTGSNGLLGQKLTDLYLTKDGYELIASGKGKNRHPQKNGYAYIELDITNLENVQEVITQINPDTVINTAAMTQVDDCEHDPQKCQELNVHAVEYLVQTCNKINAHFIQLSTDFIFDGKNGPYQETDKPNPLSIYGQSKLDAEQHIKAFSKKWSIARTVLVYGLVADMSRSNIVLWAKGALEAGKKINVVDDQYRSPTLAEDLAIGCFLIENQKALGVYNISGKDFLNIYKLVQRVATYFNLSMENVSKISSEILNQAAKRPPITGFDLTKSIKELGYNPHSFEEGIALLMDQIKKYQP